MVWIRVTKSPIFFSIYTCKRQTLFLYSEKQNRSEISLDTDPKFGTELLMRSPGENKQNTYFCQYFHSAKRFRFPDTFTKFIPSWLCVDLIA